MSENMDRHGEDAEYERPWTEEQWEKEMRDSDLRAARFGELLETLMDHPNRDVVVAREMGWDELADAMEEHRGENLEMGPPLEFEDGDELAHPRDTLGTCGTDDDPFPSSIRRGELKQIPAYALSNRAAEAVRNAIQPYQKTEFKDEIINELMSEAFIGIHIACAKITGGHAMGYDDDVLCGNIVKNKLALDGARQSIRAFEDLKSRDIFPNELIDQILPILREAEAAIDARITELRGKVWWS